MNPLNTNAAAAAPAVNAAGKPADLAVPGVVRATEDALESALMGAINPAPQHQDDPPPPPAEGDPAGEPAPLQPAEPGQDDPTATPADGEPPEGGTPAEGGDETVLSQTGDPELDAALAQLSPAMRQHVVQVAGLLGDKTLKPGEIPRIGQLLSERHELSEQLTEARAKVEELKANPPAGTAGGATGTVALPGRVAACKTLAECEARMDTAQTNSEILQDFLRDNVGPDTTVYDLQTGEPAAVEADGQRYLTRADLKSNLAGWRAEMKALPKHANALQQTAQFTEMQKANRAQAFTDFAWLKDVNHPDAKRIPETLKAVPALSKTIAPEYFASVYISGTDRHNAELQAKATGKLAEFNAAWNVIRKLAAQKSAGANGNGNGHAAAPVVTKPQGKVQLGKPHTAAGAAAPRSLAGMDRFKAALPKPGQKVTVDHLENALAALPAR